MKKRNTTYFIPILVLILIIILILAFIILNKSYKVSDVPNQVITKKTIDINLGEEFILEKGQSAYYAGDDFKITVNDFFNSTCNVGSRCVWTGVGIAFEYSHNGIIEKGVGVDRAFGYQTAIIDSDYKTYSKLKISKIIA